MKKMRRTIPMGNRKGASGCSIMSIDSWDKIRRPIMGLSPMDGVTDAAFRYMVVKCGKPDVIFTEFVSAEGLEAGAIKLLDDLRYDEAERPVVGQIFGSSKNAFFKAFLIIE